ncbi:MAG: hypothetical protein KJP00_07765, partial [Bacteroidia bacterium]|nr:hypothetical protein [Bacteroidia bacterium]
GNTCMNKIWIGLLILILIAFGIYYYNQPSIHGQWVAETVIDLPSDTLDINVEEVRFDFGDEQYAFHSTLNYMEMGYFKHSDQSIYLTKMGTETSNRVEIIHLSPTILHIKMKNGNNERVVHLKKIVQ